jgi:hypothetical protein
MYEFVALISHSPFLKKIENQYVVSSIYMYHAVLVGFIIWHPN